MRDGLRETARDPSEMVQGGVETAGKLIRNVLIPHLLGIMKDKRSLGLKSHSEITMYSRKCIAPYCTYDGGQVFQS